MKRQNSSILLSLMLVLISYQNALSESFTFDYPFRYKFFDGFPTSDNAYRFTWNISGDRVSVNLDEVAIPYAGKVTTAKHHDSTVFNASNTGVNFLIEEEGCFQIVNWITKQLYFYHLQIDTRYKGLSGYMYSLLELHMGLYLYDSSDDPKWSIRTKEYHMNTYQII